MVAFEACPLFPARPVFCAKNAHRPDYQSGPKSSRRSSAAPLALSRGRVPVNAPSCWGSSGEGSATSQKIAHSVRRRSGGLVRACELGGGRSPQRVTLCDHIKICPAFGTCSGVDVSRAIRQARGPHPSFSTSADVAGLPWSFASRGGS